MRVADVLADDAGAQAATSGRWVRFISAYGTARRWRPRTDQPLRRSTDGNTGEQVVAQIGGYRAATRIEWLLSVISTQIRGANTTMVQIGRASCRERV